MTIQIKHAFTSAKGDGGDATLVRPSNWNAVHTTSMATLNLLGRLTAGTGAFEEIPISAVVAAALGAADGAAFLAALGVGGFRTGDVKFTVDQTAETGWLSWDGEKTLGKTGSGATALADTALAQALYLKLYDNISDTYCPVSGGRSGVALTDFNAGKTIGLPRFSGRAVIGNGTGAGIAGKNLGQYGGEENHTLTTAELASHYHSAGIYDPSHAHSVSNALTIIYSGAGSGGVGGGGAFGLPAAPSSCFSIAAAVTSVRVNSSNGLDTTYSAGSGGAHNNMQPYIALQARIKL